MAERDYYDILGVSRGATADEIKKAYRQRARKFHPDVNPGDKKAEAQFKEAQAAYDVLGDPEKKALYDQYGHAAFVATGGAGAGPRSRASEWAGAQAAGAEAFDFSQFFGPGGFTAPGGDVGGAEGGGLFDEILGRFRGGRAASGRRPGSPRRGRGLEAELTIPFLTAVRGGETTIEVDRGEGQPATVVVKVPPGIQPGARLRLRGQGLPGEPGGARGDLTIIVHVEPHPDFRREGRDLTVEVPITVAEAVLGARVEVPTLDGPKALNFPPGTSSGQRLRLRGQGVPAAGDKPAGDLYVVPRIVVPRTVDDRSRELIREFDQLNPLHPRRGG